MNDSILANIDDGLVILVVGILIVFFSLLLLFIFFQYVVPFVFNLIKRKSRKEEGQAVQTKSAKVSSGEEIAAVAAAVYLYLEETHDLENPIITISKSPKDYSPWSSKIYTTHTVLRTGLKY
ncbi:MAG: OadG family protein [Cyclobacteriaceae bacterium]|nr:OadG family protein [Cyclobacteriaceae bacterium]